MDPVVSINSIVLTSEQARGVDLSGLETVWPVINVLTGRSSQTSRARSANRRSAQHRGSAATVDASAGPGRCRFGWRCGGEGDLERSESAHGQRRQLGGTLPNTGDKFNGLNAYGSLGMHRTGSVAAVQANALRRLRFAYLMKADARGVDMSQPH